MTNREHDKGAASAPTRAPPIHSDAASESDEASSESPVAAWRETAAGLYAEHQRQLLGYARACIRSFAEAGWFLPVEAEDSVHHAFVLLLEGRLSHPDRHGEPPDSAILVARLCRTISNTCINLYRYERRRPQTTADAVDRQAIRAAVKGLKPVDPDLEARCILLARDVEAALATLPPERRRAIELYVLQDHTARETAVALGKAVKTVRNAVDRAKPTLRAALGSYGPGGE